MRFDDVLDDCQPQSGASGLAGAAFVHAVEALVNAVEVFFGDANAVVFDRDANGFAFGFEAQGAFTAFHTVVDGVDEQVGEDLANLDRTT